MMPSQKEIEKKVGQSKLIFIGTVKKIGASNVAALEANNQLALVEVKTVALAPEAFRGITGTTVTVKMPAKTKLRSGDSRLFYTKKLMYGENLAVEAVAVDAVDKDHQQITKEVRNALDNMERIEQLERISKATLIVEGKVTRMQESGFNKNYPLSFKSPFWISLTIQIARVIKGKYEGRTIEVFINKGGETEEATPLEIDVSKTGVWLLRKEAIFKDLKNKVEVYLIEEPDDFLNSYEYAMLTQPQLS